MKTEAPSVQRTSFPCSLCGARLDAAHLEPGYPGTVCTFCGAHLPERPELVLLPDVERPGAQRSRRLDVGETLREARQGRGQTLADAARATRIKKEYLDGLEQGVTSFDPYPGRIYGRFFLREYADHLGLDAKPLLRAFDADADVEFVSTLPAPLSRRPPRRRRWAIAAAVVLVSMLVGTSIMSRSPAESPATPGRSAAGERSGASNHARPTPPSNHVTGVHAVMTFHARCWVQVFADGKRVVDRTFTAGQDKRISAKHDMTLHFGSGGSVTLTANGKRVATGAPGQVVDLRLKWRDGRLVLP
jgi:cytoskeletal protein RodZ